MFTGIVESMGTLESRNGGRFVFRSSLATEDASIGDSISVNGVCLTVVDLDGDTWAVDAVQETLDRSNLGSLEPGSKVNVERSVRASDRLGGHIVQGHVDATGTVIAPAPDLRIEIPKDLTRYVVEKGSICIDGVSLTVVQAFDDGFTIAIIPHTSQQTTLGELSPGDTVNVEVDALARYAERMLTYTQIDQQSRKSVHDD